MKFHAALLTLTLVGRSRGQCPAELTGVESITSTLTMYYALVLSDSEPGIFCARFESQSEAWLGWGINPSGEMIGGEAVIGLPDEGTVRKYNLFDESMEGVVEMDDALQTLMDTSIVQENGTTIMSFAKYLEEDQYGIFDSGLPNSFIWAVGSSNALGYHPERGNFQLQFESATGSSTTSSVASVTTPPFDNTPAGNSTSGFNDGVNTDAPTPTATDDSAGMPDSATAVPTYAPIAEDVADSSSSEAQAFTNATLQVTTNETDFVESDNATDGSTIDEDADVEWDTPSPTPARSEGEPATPSPSAVSNSSDAAEPTAASTESPTYNSTSESTESSTSNSTAESTESSTSNATAESTESSTSNSTAESTESSTSNSTAESTESSASNTTSDSSASNTTSDSTDADRAPGTEASASAETTNSAVSSQNIGGLVVGFAALAIAFGF
ncbi:hypothetical protein ACHAW6_007153 [Cyclotella cf. meneghiniana]